VAGLTAVVFAACTSSPRQVRRPTAVPTAGVPSGVQTTTHSVPFVRACAESVYGRLSAGWKPHSVVVGPLAFVGLRDFASSPGSEFAPRGSKWNAVKVLVVVSNGVPSIRVRVPASEADRLALLYDPSAFADSGAYGVADGEREVEFQPCQRGKSPYGASTTQFNGGFIVAGPQCSRLEVVEPGAETRSIRVAFGSATCRGT
jgi:hypothetical protein